ncbi:hypothetical protein [Streptomyces sp. NPDC048636]|uniref:hypothetical protein n=1 Tax=Streptomyces sp. NPDC048636 TaxID=3155762 RepID=UPI003437C61E
MDEVTQPAEGERPPALGPTDEAMLARAQILREIGDAVLRDIAQLYPSDDHGSVLRDALFVKGLAEQLVERAVVVERERGASWADIGEAAGSSKQAANERWNTKMGAWVAMGRQRTGLGRGPADPADHAQDLDEWYADLVGEGPHAISTLLPSLHDQAARAEAGACRTEVQQLTQRAEELRKETEAAYNAAMEAVGTDASEEKNAVWAAKHFARAEVYERLATLEEPIAAEHRRSAAAQRRLAQDILRGRTPEEITK